MNLEKGGGDSSAKCISCSKVWSDGKELAVVLPPVSFHHNRWWDEEGMYAQNLVVSFRAALVTLATLHVRWPAWGSERAARAATPRARPRLAARGGAYARNHE